MKISIMGNQGLAHKFSRKNANTFQVLPDFQKSTVREGNGWNLRFYDKLILDAEDYRGTGYRIDFSNLKGDNSILVSSIQSHQERPVIQRVTLDTAWAVEDGRRLALQVASALTQVPFLDRLLELPVPEQMAA